MERYNMFLDWKNQYCENDYTTQSNVQIQCNPNAFFTELEQKFHNLYGNTKHLEQPKQSWERKMELEE